MKTIQYILLTLLAIGILSSCGTKQKALSKEKEKIEITTETETKTDSIAVTEEKEVRTTETDSTAEKNEVTITDIKEKDLEIEADEGGEVTVTEEKTATGTKTTFTGVSSVRVRESAKKIENTLREQINVLKRDSTASQRKDSISKSVIAKLNQTIKTQKKKIESSKEVDTTIGFYGYGFWFLLAIILLYLAWKNRHKLKPFLK